jgi:hypothetical protein
MCSVIGGRGERPNTAVASRASHFLVRMTAQSILNREANPLATPFHFAGIVADFTHLADICHSWAIRQAIWLTHDERHRRFLVSALRHGDQERPVGLPLCPACFAVRNVGLPRGHPRVLTRSSRPYRLTFAIARGTIRCMLRHWTLTIIANGRIFVTNWHRTRSKLDRSMRDSIF